MRRSRVALVAVAVIAVVLVALALVMHLSPFSTGTSSGGSTPSTAPSNTGASTSTSSPGYPRLESLDGTIVSLGGDEITRELWSKMRDYRASDPAVKPYLDWLREALSPKPLDALTVPWYPGYRYWWFNDDEYYHVGLGDAVRWVKTSEPIPLRRSVDGTAVLCRGVINRVWVSEEHGYRDYLEPRACLIPPLNNSIVRLGVVELPFGAGLIVTGYQVGNGLTIVVHGTIINETGWRELLARTSLFFRGAGPVGPGWSNITGVSETGWVLGG